MNRTVKTVLKYLFTVLLTLGFLYFAFKGTDVDMLWHDLSHANYWWVLGMLAVLVVSHLLRAWRWEYLLRPIKRNLRYRNLVSALMVGYMMNNVLPRAGEIVRPYAIGKLEGISRSAAFGTLLVERMFDFLSMVLVLALIPLVYSGPLTQTFPWLEQASIWITVVTLAFMGFFTFLMFRRDIVERILTFFTRHLSPPRAKLVERITHSFLDGFLFLKDRKTYFMIGFLSLLVWGLYILMMYLPFYAFDLPQKYPHLDMAAALVVEGISSLGIIIPTPGAIGPYHYFTVQTLTQLYHVDGELARSYAAVTNAVGVFGISLIGFYYFFRDNLRMADVMKEERVQDEMREQAPTVS